MLRGFCCTKCPQHHPCRISTSWHDFGRQMQNQVLPQKKKITAGSPSPPRLPAAEVSVQAVRGGGGSGERGLFLMPGRKRRASLSRGSCLLALGSWSSLSPTHAPASTSPQPAGLPRSLRLAGSLPGRGASVAMICCDPSKCVQLISRHPSVLSFAQDDRGGRMLFYCTEGT